MGGRGLTPEHELLLGGMLLDCVPLQLNKLNKFMAENEELLLESECFKGLDYCLHLACFVSIRSYTKIIVAFLPWT
jgi:hypothetical protein